MSSIHRYRSNDLMGDYVRAGAGILVTLFPLIFVTPPLWLTFIMVLVGCLCGVFLVRTYDKQRSIVRVDDEGISVDSFRKVTIPWVELTRMSLSYYSLRRDRMGGWMQLTLKGQGPTIKIDSRIESFLVIVACASEAARDNRVMVSQITIENVRALQIPGF